MSNLLDFEDKRGQLEALDPAEVMQPFDSIDAIIRHAEGLYAWSMHDRDALVAAGLNPVFIDDLPKRAGALREAESQWNAKVEIKGSAVKEWKQKAPEAIALRQQLLHDLTYAYRNTPHVLGRVQATRNGSGCADLIQDLNDLAVIGRENPAELEAIRFDGLKLETAAQCADELGALLGDADSQAEFNQAKDLRDRAFTHLHEAVSEIVACGRYVFWHDKERLRGYVTRMRKRKKNGTNGQEPEQQPGV